MSAVEAVLAHMPAQDYLVSASHDGRRSGTLVRWVQRCGVQPPMVCVAMRKGHPIEPLIRDSKRFALSQIAPGDLLLRRLFGDDHDCADDPFLALPIRCAGSGPPIPIRAVAYMECDLLRHFDIECDHEIYVGSIRGAGLLAASARRDDAPPGQRASRSA